MRLIFATGAVSGSEISARLGIEKSTVTDLTKPLIKAGKIHENVVGGDSGRKRRAFSLADNDGYFVGINLGVRQSQIGVTTFDGEIVDEDDFETSADVGTALQILRERIDGIIAQNSDRTLNLIGVSVPGMVDAERLNLISAPNLGWKNVKIAEHLSVPGVPIVVENDSTAAAMYEARVKIGVAKEISAVDFLLVRSGTGIGVGLVSGGEVYRGSGPTGTLIGEFGHMTIVAGGKSCVCGNRGCWEKYASAASAASLYLGDRPPARGESLPRFVEIVSKAENGDNRSRRTLEKIGDYLGIGIANVIMGVGMPRVIVSGRLVLGWKFIKEPLYEAVEKSIVGRFGGWSVEPGEPTGSAIGGALEVAIDEYLRTSAHQ
ncbi:MAG: ROK family transcriptional regulator [Pyrinomonadaceae bacterium]